MNVQNLFEENVASYYATWKWDKAKVQHPRISYMKWYSWYMYKSVPLPLDKDGFVESFDIKNYDSQKVKQFYDTYGLVVFRDILNHEEVDLTVDDLWNEVIKDYKNVKRDDPKTWNFLGMHKSFGFVSDEPICQLQIWKNRVNLKVYQCFKDLYEISAGTKLEYPLITCLDRGSMMRPTVYNPEWKTHNLHHFDIDPPHWTGLIEYTVYTTYNKYYERFNQLQMMMGYGNYLPFQGYTKLAGVLALTDTNYSSGGFEAACGFQNYIKTWCIQRGKNSYNIESDEKLMYTFQKVFMRKGSLMLFSRYLPHNIYPNESKNFRYAQYLRMTPESTLMLTYAMKEKRKDLLRSVIPKELEQTEICKETLML